LFKKLFNTSEVIASISLSRDGGQLLKTLVGNEGENIQSLLFLFE
jgi:hypothetical protein